MASKCRATHMPTTFKAWFVDVDQLVLVECAVHDEVKQRNRHYQRLNQAVDQTQQNCHAGVRDLPAIIYILVLPQPGFCTLRGRQPSLDVQQHKPWPKQQLLHKLRCPYVPDVMCKAPKTKCIIRTCYFVHSVVGCVLAVSRAVSVTLVAM